MARSLFNYYLEKASKEKNGFRKKLCRPLSERLIYVPFLKRKTDGALSVTFTVPFLKGASMLAYPVFSSRKEFARWAVCEDEDFQEFSILASDFCLSLESGSAIILNAGGRTETFLEPCYVEYMAGKLRKVEEKMELAPRVKPLSFERKEVNSLKKWRDLSSLRSETLYVVKESEVKKKKYAAAVAALNARASLLSFFGLKALAD